MAKTDILGPCLDGKRRHDNKHAAPSRSRGQNRKGRARGVHAMSQREVVWILLGAVLIGAVGAGAFVVATYALSLF
jgi:hypothetical protein